MTNAERQRQYRQRRKEDSDRLNMLVSPNAKRQLERLARHNGETQRAILEQLLHEAEGAVVEGLEGADQSAYYDGPGVTA